MTEYLSGLADPNVLPRITDVNRGFFEAAASGRLVVRRCGHCGLLFHYPRPFCPQCHGDQLSWEEMSGLGRVVVSAEVRRPAWDDLPRPLPYTVAIVDLDEGPRFLSTVERARSVTCGLRVRAVFEPVADLGLVRFVPVDPDVLSPSDT